MVVTSLVGGLNDWTSHPVLRFAVLKDSKPSSELPEDLAPLEEESVTSWAEQPLSVTCSSSWGYHRNLSVSLPLDTSKKTIISVTFCLFPDPFCVFGNVIMSVSETKLYFLDPFATTTPVFEGYSAIESDFMSIP